MMGKFFINLALVCFCNASAFAQQAPQKQILQKQTPQQDVPVPTPEAPKLEIPDTPIADNFSGKPKGGKDLTVRSEEGRAKMLEQLFRNLSQSVTEEDAKLIAEEIWAVFLQSGSATVDFILLRGITAEKNGDLVLARRMYDHVLRLAPDYAEGWSRSGRLAFNQRDFNRATSDITHALTIEPRHFYALWTLANILETLAHTDQALEVYIEAEKIYPLHPKIKARVKKLKESVIGKAL
ncbi:MAG: hypothetical protein V3U57_01655 [Robiginitomaculum sp.]